jgi:hypothetical protein
MEMLQTQFLATMGNLYASNIAGIVSSIIIKEA